MFEIEKVDQVIEKTCERIVKDIQIESEKVAAEEIKALAELIYVRTKYC